jgi:hypothetical protein
VCGYLSVGGGSRARGASGPRWRSQHGPPSAAQPPFRGRGPRAARRPRPRRRRRRPAPAAPLWVLQRVVQARLGHGAQAVDEGPQLGVTLRVGHQREGLAVERVGDLQARGGVGPAATDCGRGRGRGQEGGGEGRRGAVRRGATGWGRSRPGAVRAPRRAFPPRDARARGAHPGSAPWRGAQPTTCRHRRSPSCRGRGGRAPPRSAAGGAAQQRGPPATARRPAPGRQRPEAWRLLRPPTIQVAFTRAGALPREARTWAQVSGSQRPGGVHGATNDGDGEIGNVRWSRVGGGPHHTGKAEGEVTGDSNSLLKAQLAHL